MKTVAGPLAALLNAGGPFRFADLYEITLFAGTVLRWTGSDYDVVYGGNTFLSSGPKITRGPVREAAGLTVDTLDVSLGVGDRAVTLGGIGLVQAAKNGAFDAARFVLYRAFMPNFGDTSLGVLLRFSGEVGEVDPLTTAVGLIVKSDMQKLQVMIPRNLITPACSHILFDAGCGLTKASFAVNGTMTAGSTALSILSAVGGASGYYNLGVLVVTSGPSTGARVPIASFASGTFGLGIALPFAPTGGGGDTFTVYPGCDKTSATCNTKFSNLTRFRGFPNVPRPESAR